MARRDPQMLTAFLCARCGERIKWGDVLRILRKERGQPDYEGRESYAHHDCIRAELSERVPLVFGREWRHTIQWPDDSAEIDGKPCGLCGEAILPRELTKLRLQKPIGTVRKPSFMELSVPVHARCWRKLTVGMP